MVLDLGRSTQYGDKFSVLGLTQDGHTTGRLTGVETSPEGVVSARYTNGVVQPLGQVAMTNFVNPQGLQSLGDNVWAETYNSGEPRRGQASTADTDSTTTPRPAPSQSRTRFMITSAERLCRPLYLGARAASTLPPEEKLHRKGGEIAFDTGNPTAETCKSFSSIVSGLLCDSPICPVTPPPSSSASNPRRMSTPSPAAWPTSVSCPARPCA